MQSSSGTRENMAHYLQRGMYRAGFPTYTTYERSMVEDARGQNSVHDGGNNTAEPFRRNCGGGQFFKLNNATRPDSRGLTYAKNGLNLYDYTLAGATDDGLVTSSIRIVSPPCTERTRT